jgi:surface antigen
MTGPFGARRISQRLSFYARASAAHALNRSRLQRFDRAQALSIVVATFTRTAHTEKIVWTAKAEGDAAMRKLCKLYKLCTVLLFSGLLASQADAAGLLGILNGNYNSLDETPYAGFGKEDRQLFIANLQKTLDESPDGSTTQWRNEKTGCSGSVMVMKGRDQRPNCRVARIVNIHKARRGEEQYEFCKANDKWAVWQEP